MLLLLLLLLLQASRGGKTAVLAAPLALEKEQVSVLLPTGCTLEFVLPVQDPATAGSSGNGGDSGGSKTLFGVVYKDGSNGLFGAGVWTGYMFKAFGLYSSDEAAAQTARCAGGLGTGFGCDQVQQPIQKYGWQLYVDLPTQVVPRPLGCTAATKRAVPTARCAGGW
jgi:hypothetical protein